MSRDYAKRIPHKHRRPKQRPRRRWVLVLLSLVLLGLLPFGFKQCHSRFSLFSAAVSSERQEAVQFDFYPNNEAAAPLKSPASLAPALAPSPPIEKKTAVGRYFLQLGVFQSENEAAEMRVSLLLAGWDVNVAKSVVAGHVQYQVHLGPYSTLEAAKAAQKTLQDQGLMSVIKE